MGSIVVAALRQADSVNSTGGAVEKEA